MDSLFQNVLDGIFSAAFLAAILRVTTPILLPSLGALISDRAGVINIGLEGTMLIAAFAGVIFSAYGRDWWGDSVWLPWFGLAMALLLGVLTGLLLGFFHLRLKADLILSGIAINFLGSAGTIAIMYEITGSRGNTGGILNNPVMPFIQLPEFMKDVPVLSFFFKIFDNQSVMTWIAFGSVIAVWYLMYRTPVGMHLRAVGENPEAAASVGIRVQRTRYLALALSGFLAALGGVHMSMGYLTFFERDMTSGRGFIALATPYLGGGHPIGTGFASLIFGFFDAISTRIGSLAIPSQLPQMLPFIATVMALVIYALQSRLTVRVRTLRSAEGEDFDASFWGAIQRLSVLHMFLAMLAVSGLIVTVSMFSAPDGFQDLGTDWENQDVFMYAIGIGLASLVLIGSNLPFMLNVERIGRQVWFSAAAAGVSLWL
ncbi:MAG: ABC transporter permease [Anaerolineae bacterium]|nr:ABC transporter permease [Anaerolineae bacterium]